ncbi:hypothetical protein ACFSQD_18620 [Flavihumibacter stibioxidans]|uniref:YD repeat-containing protein n=1 Tax=Flavihumibacter stibioxidans TaxID=1834163 RepID=A0ABR7MC10_9BACT|nr:hypothetical protein [Flavihumibacter stibioxidans]MBC6492573.1 hypothetical protein [Flavihumibacter stibioxidans]
MKQVLNLFLLSVLFFAACKKENEVPESIPQPIPAPVAGKLQFAVELETAVDADSIDAVADLSLSSGQAIWVRKHIRLGKQNSQWVSAPMELPQGQYKLTAFMLKNGEELISVAPVAGSVRAAGVQQALPVSVGVTASGASLHPQVLPIGPVDGPAAFGYPAHAFQSNAMDILVRASVKVGNVMYDSIPASLELISTLANGQEYKAQFALVPGANLIPVARQAVQHRLVMKQWNTVAERVITPEEVQENGLLVLAAERDIKRLRMEMDYLEVEGQWQLKGNSIFSYRADGDLDRVQYYQKKPQYQDLQATYTDKGVYSGNRLTGVLRYDDRQVQVGKTWYEFDGAGKITHVSNQSYDVTIHGAIEQGVENGRQQTEIYYLFDNGSTMHYSMTYLGGNKIADKAISSKGGQEGGTYGYDTNINPYQQIMFPDLYLSRSSKNNLSSQQKGYTGAIPSSVPYKFEYTYDADGYPVTLIKYYKSGMTGLDLYRTKTTFTY